MQNETRQKYNKKMKKEKIIFAFCNGHLLKIIMKFFTKKIGRVANKKILVLI